MNRYVAYLTKGGKRKRRNKSDQAEGEKIMVAEKKR